MLKQPTLKPIPNGVERYELLRDYKVEAEGVSVTVPQYFRYDGASIPKPAWQLIYTPFHPDVMAPSLVHDWLFYSHQVDRRKTDDIFYTLLKKNGVSNLMANTMWVAVRTSGFLSWKNDEEDIEDLVKLCNKVRNRPDFDAYHFPSEVQEKCK